MNDQLSNTMSATTSRGSGMRGEWRVEEAVLDLIRTLANLRVLKLPGLCGNTRYLTVAFSFWGAR
jgi:hypothetical protein